MTYLTEDDEIKAEMQKNMKSYTKSFDDSIEGKLDTYAYIGVINEAIYNIDMPSEERTYNEPNITIISELYIPPKYRRRGIATELMNKVIKDADDNCQDLWLETHPKDIDFDDLVEFYESLGFIRDIDSSYMIRKSRCNKHRD